MRSVLLLLTLAVPARAQPADCAAWAVGPELRLAPRIGLEGRPGVAQGLRGQVPIDFGAVPMLGTLCGADPPPDQDVLRGTSAPGGLLRGDGPGDVLHDRWRGRVTVAPGR
jgi:hypothetical protein